MLNFRRENDVDITGRQVGEEPVAYKVSKNYGKLVTKILMCTICTLLRHISSTRDINCYRLVCTGRVVK